VAADADGAADALTAAVGAADSTAVAEAVTVADGSAVATAPPEWQATVENKPKPTKVILTQFILYLHSDIFRISLNIILL
jgi:hypothetical protein